jgi:hypothetical protein
VTTVNRIIAKLIAASWLLFSMNWAWAEQLAPNSPELQQLQAMGYEAEKPDAGDAYSVVSNGSIKITLSKNDDDVTVMRFFTRKTGLSSGQEIDLLKIVNKMNLDLPYQVYLTDGFIAFALYAHGPYQRRTLAAIVRLSEKAGDHFASYPGLLELLN